jgi:hypothetical protein
MRHIVLNTLALATLACGVVAAALPDVAAAEDPRTEARLLTLDGKFEAANKVLEAAPEEVRNDPKLRFQLGDMALKWCKRQEKHAKVPGLIAAKNHFAEALEVDKADHEAALAALETGLDLVAVFVEAKQPTSALRHVDWCVKVGEDALANGSDTPDVRLAIASSRDQRAKLSHKINDFDRIVEDYDRSAELAVSCADTASKPADALSAAARTYLDLAAFIAEGRPIDEEVRDEAALLDALDVAARACELKGADEDQYTVHLLALIAIHRAQKEGSKFDREDFGKPYMQELGKREGLQGLDLFIPKADGWKKLESSGDWDLIYDRKLEGDDTAARFMIVGYPFSEKFGGKSYDQIEKIAEMRFEGQTKDEFKDVTFSKEPEQIKVGKKKKGPEIWHHEIAGTLTGGRSVRVGEWMMLRTKKEGITWRIRVVDYRNVPDLTEPDIVEFISRAFGLSPDDDDDDKKKGKKKKRK